LLKLYHIIIEPPFQFSICVDEEADSHHSNFTYRPSIDSQKNEKGNASNLWTKLPASVLEERIFSSFVDLCEGIILVFDDIRCHIVAQALEEYSNSHEEENSDSGEDGSDPKYTKDSRSSLGDQKLEKLLNAWKQARLNLGLAEELPGKGVSHLFFQQ
jgi:hypothetical protein